MSTENIQIREQRDLEQRIIFPLFDSLPEEIWLHIFSFLDTKSLISISITTKKWNHLVNDDLLWENHFFRNFNLSLWLPFNSWRKSALNHFYWRKNVCFKQITEIPELKFHEFFDKQRALVEVDGFLKIIDLSSNSIQKLFNLPIENYIKNGEYIIATFKDCRGYGVWSKTNGKSSHHRDESKINIIFKSKSEHLSARSSYNLQEAYPIHEDGSLNLDKATINFSCAPETFEPMIYTSCLKDDLFFVGCYPGKILLYRSGELIATYEEEDEKYIFHLSICDQKLIIGFQDTNPFEMINIPFRQRIVIYDLASRKKTMELNLPPFPYCCIFQEHKIIYINANKEIIYLDINTLKEQRISIPRESNESYHNVIKVSCQEDLIWILFSSGQLYLYHKVTGKSVLAREKRPSFGTEPSGLDFFISSKYLVVKERLARNEILEIFNIEANNIKRICEKYPPIHSTILYFEDVIVLKAENVAEIFRAPLWDTPERFEGVLWCAKKNDQLIIPTNSGEILFFDPSLSITKILLEFPIVHANLFGSYLFCINDKSCIEIIDINSRLIVFKTDQLPGLDEAPSNLLPYGAIAVSLHGDLKKSSEENKFPRISSSIGIVLDKTILICINHSLIKINLDSQTHSFANENFPNLSRFLFLEGKVFCLGSDHEIQGVIDPQSLIFSKANSESTIKYSKICYDRFLLLIKSNGIMELIDLISREKTFSWEVINDFERLGKKSNLIEIGDNKLIVLCNNKEPVLYDLLNGKKESLDSGIICS